MSIQIQLRRGTTTEWSSGNPILAVGELGLDTVLNQFKIGNGVLHWNALPVASGTQGPAGATVSSLASLTADVNVSSITNGQVLTYNSTTSKWVNAAPVGAVTTVNGYTGAVTLTFSDVGAASIAQLATKADLAGATFTGPVVGTDLTVNNLTVSGTQTVINTNNLAISDSIVYLSDNQYTTDNVDIGIYGAYGTTGGTGANHKHAGLVRDSSDKVWKLFSNSGEVTGNIVPWTGQAWDGGYLTYDGLKIGSLNIASFTTAGYLTTTSGGAISSVTTLPTDATRAPLASPTFTGVPAAPTATVSTSTTQLATTAFVLGQVGTAAPLVNGTVAVGTSLLYARQDHVHGTDTTRAALASPTFTGTPLSTTAVANTNTTQIATTAFVLGQVGIATPLVVSGTTLASAVTLSSLTKVAALSGGVAGFVKTDVSGNLTADSTAYATTASVPLIATTVPVIDGNAAIGALTTYAAADHIHPTDTSRAALIASQLYSGTQTIAPASATGVAVIVKGFANQTADLQQWQDSTGAVKKGASSIGQMYLGGTTPLTTSGGNAATATSDGSIVTVTTGANLNLSVGQFVTLAGFTSTTGNLNQTWRIATAPATNQFTFAYAQALGTIGGATPTVSHGSAQISVTPYGQYSTGVIIRGNATQTANLQEWQLSTGVAVAKVDGTGAGTFTGITVSAPGANVNSLTVSNTASVTGNLTAGANLLLGASQGVGGGAKVFAMVNATTVPTTNPTGGGVLYSNAGALSWMGTSGAAQAIANADGTSPFALSTDARLTGLPQNSQGASYQLVLTDAGKHIYVTATGQTITVPANASVAFPVGTTITVVNAAAVSTSIAITTDTMWLAGVGTTGTRTLAAFGMATLLKIGTTTWMASGNGLS